MLTLMMRRNRLNPVVMFGFARRDIPIVAM